MEENNGWKATVGKTVGVVGSFSSIKMEIECPIADVDYATKEVDEYIKQELAQFPDDWKKKEEPKQNYGGKSYGNAPKKAPKPTYKKKEQNLSEAEQIKADKGFGTPKQWKIILDQNLDINAVEDYSDLQSAIKQVFNN